MPALIKYERKPLTASQLLALREYIKRNRLKEQNSDVSVVESVSELTEDDAKQECSLLEAEPEAMVKIVADPSPPPSAQQRRDERKRSLRDVHEQLEELECVLDGLKRKKHELFEEFKSLLSSKNESKKQAIGVERPNIHGFPPPFMGQLTGQETLMSPYRQVVGGLKRPKSPSPPLVQLYSPSSSLTLQSLYETPPAHQPAATASNATFQGQGDMPRLPFQQLGNKMSGHPDNILYMQLQQNISSRDPRQQTHTGTSQDNPHPSSSSQAAGNNYVAQERQFIETRNLQDRHLPASFGSPQSSVLGVTGHDLGTQNNPRQALINHPAFLQQNVLPGQQQASANVPDGPFTGIGSFGKECPGFTSPGSHHPQGYMKRGSHLPSRSSRFY